MNGRSDLFVTRVFGEHGLYQRKNRLKKDERAWNDPLEIFRSKSPHSSNFELLLFQRIAYRGGQGAGDDVCRRLIRRVLFDYWDYVVSTLLQRY